MFLSMDTTHPILMVFPKAQPPLLFNLIDINDLNAFELWTGYLRLNIEKQNVVIFQSSKKKLDKNVILNLAVSRLTKTKLILSS